MSTRLIVVRHGNTFNSGDVICRVGSRTDLDLTATGVAQLERVGRALKQANLLPDVVFSAPLRRTQQSAEALIRTSGVNLKVEDAKFLTELDYGNDDGKPEDEVVLRLGIVENPEAIHPDTTLDELRERGKAALKLWDKEAILPRGWRFLSADITSEIVAWREFGALVASKYANKTVVAVTSNGIARFSRSILPENSPLPENGLKLSTGAYGIYEYIDNAWRCTQWNVKPNSEV